MPCMVAGSLEKGNEWYEWCMEAVLNSPHIMVIIMRMAVVRMVGMVYAAIPISVTRRVYRITMTG